MSPLTEQTPQFWCVSISMSPKVGKGALLTSCAHLMLNYNEGFANCHKQLIIFCYIIFSHTLITLLCLYSIVSSLLNVYYTSVVYYMKSCQSKVRKNMHIQMSVECSRFEQPYSKLSTLKASQGVFICIYKLSELVRSINQTERSTSGHSRQSTVSYPDVNRV